MTSDLTIVPHVFLLLSVKSRRQDMSKRLSTVNKTIRNGQLPLMRNKGIAHALPRKLGRSATTLWRYLLLLLLLLLLFLDISLIAGNSRQRCGYIFLIILT